MGIPHLYVQCESPYVNVWSVGEAKRLTSWSIQDSVVFFRLQIHLGTSEKKEKKNGRRPICCALAFLLVSSKKPSSSETALACVDPGVDHTLVFRCKWECWAFRTLVTGLLRADDANSAWMIVSIVNGCSRRLLRDVYFNTSEHAHTRTYILRHSTIDKQQMIEGLSPSLAPYRWTDMGR